MTDIKDLGLSYRAYNCLMRAGIDTLEKLREASEEDLMNVKSLGRKTFKEVLEVRNTNPWIPVTEHLPDEEQKVWVTKEYHGGDRRTEPSIFKNNEFYVVGYSGVTCTNLVKAWCVRAVPEPYKEVDHEEK